MARVLDGSYLRLNLQKLKFHMFQSNTVCIEIVKNYGRNGEEKDSK